MEKDSWLTVASGAALLGVGLVGSAIGIAVAEIITREQTLDRVIIHGKPCSMYPEVQERVGDIKAAQDFVDQLGGVTSRVCHLGETKEGEVWYSTGS